MAMTTMEYNALENALTTAFASMTDEEITAMLKEQYQHTKIMLNGQG